MSRWIFACGGLALPVLGFAQVTLPRNSDWWDQMLWSRLSYSGSRTLGYQSYSFRGDADAFASLTNYGTGLQHFTDIGNLSIQGNKVFGLLDFRATFTDNRFSDPEQQQYTLNYRKGFWDVSYGTVQASLLNTNRFANFSRSLNGFVGDYKNGRLETKLVSSEARGEARTVTMEGNNTSGPYYLQSGRIIGGSVKVLLDGTELKQGEDYIADVTVGSISFIGRVIPPTSTIVASYESYDVTGSGGSIRGAGVAYDLGAAGRIGLSTQEQRVGTTNNSAFLTQLFQGFGIAGASYVLDYEPIPASIQVLVNGVQRTFSPVDDGVAEFYLNPSISTVVISRDVIPTTATLQINYLPKVVQAVDGNRRVTGFDWRVPVGTKGSGSSITYSLASGKMDGLGGSSGNAESIDMLLKEGKGAFKAGFRKIEPGFRTIEQTGFSRNEDAAEYRYDYSTKGFTTSLSTSNNLISIDTGSTLSSSRLMTNAFNLRYSDPTKPIGEANRSQTFSYTQTRLLTTDDTNLNSLSYKDSFRNKKISFGYSVDSQSGHGRVNGVLTGLGVNSYGTNAVYNAGKNWSIIASATKSYVRTDTIRSSGYDYSLRANMAQTGPWSGGIEYAISDSGVLASLGGFLNGSSLGYGTGGFGNSGGSGVISTGQLKARRSAFNATHQAGDNLTLGLTYSSTTLEGSTTSNSRIDTASLDTSWKVNADHSLVLSLVKVKSDFLTLSTGSSNSDVISGMFIGNPGKMWSYSFGYNLMKTTGTSLDQNNVGMSGDLNYRFAKRHRLFVNGTVSRTRGAYPQDDLSAQAGYAYSIASGISLVGKYSFRDLRNLDPTSTGGAFRANGISFEISFDLASRR